MKQVKNFSAYTINEDGIVYNKQGKQICQWIDNQGYKQVVLYRDGKRYFRRVHRLVWESYNGDIKEGMVINHIDSNKTNNSLSNLEVVTNQYNVSHFFKNNVRKSYNLNVYEKQTNTFIGNYTSVTKMCEDLSLNRKTVYSILKGTKETNNYPYYFENID